MSSITNFQIDHLKIDDKRIQFTELPSYWAWEPVDNYIKSYELYGILRSRIKNTEILVDWVRSGNNIYICVQNVNVDSDYDLYGIKENELIHFLEYFCNIRSFVASSWLKAGF